MASVDNTSAVPRSDRLGQLSLLVFGPTLVLLLGSAVVTWLQHAIETIHYPYQLSYGEGVVWQQAAMILRGEGYAPLEDDPHVVFHYPPVFHLASGLTSLITGDLLSGARVASGFSALLCLVAIAGTLHGVAQRGCADARPVWTISLLVGFVAGALFLTSPAVATWGQFGRVDTMAFAAGLCAMWAGLNALDRPRNAWLLIAFVALSLYSKHSALALPTALFSMLLLADTRRALGIMLRCLALGLIVLAVLMIYSEGRFLTHIIGYNINRMDPARLQLGLRIITTERYILLCGVPTAIYIAYRLLGQSLPSGLSGLSATLRASLAARFDLFLILYLILGSLKLLLIAKVGSDTNYAFDFIAALSLLTGRGLLLLLAPGALATRRPVLFAVAALTLILDATRLPVLDRQPTPAEDALYALIQSTDAPLISDEMVMLRRSGKELFYEPAIFAELEAMGVWDSAPVIDRIERGEFPFAIARYYGDFEERKEWFPASVRAALEAHFPVLRRFGAYIVYMPAGSAPAGSEPLDPRTGRPFVASGSETP
ncbi:MAG: glycosyltransferase family 39 protein [Pseudomonadota bacterium]